MEALLTWHSLSVCHMSDSLGLVSHSSSNSTVQSETHNRPLGVVPFPNVHDPVMDLPIPLGHVVFKSSTPPGS